MAVYGPGAHLDVGRKGPWPHALSLSGEEREHALGVSHVACGLPWSFGVTGGTRLLGLRINGNQEVDLISQSGVDLQLVRISLLALEALETLQKGSSRSSWSRNGSCDGP